METVAESKDMSLAEELLRWFMGKGDKEVFASMLYTCYELIKPDIALEIAWRFGLLEFCIPYFIQFTKDLSTRVESVQKQADNIVKKDEEKTAADADRPLDVDMGMLFPGMGGQP